MLIIFMTETSDSGLRNCSGEYICVQLLFQNFDIVWSKQSDFMSIKPLYFVHSIILGRITGSFNTYDFF